MAKGGEAFGTTRSLPAIGRVPVAGLFPWSAAGKLLDSSATIQYITSTHLPAPSLAFAAAVVVEAVGGIFLVIGYRVRFAAAALAFYTLLAAVTFHATWTGVNQVATS